MGTFFRGDRCARNRDHEAVMMVDGRTVNARGRCSSVQKKAGPERARLKVWPREADTITFQEGLLSARATGGGGQIRNASAQGAVIMVSACAMQQLSGPHVSHAQTKA